MTNIRESEWVPSACILCECNCGIEVELGGDEGRNFVRFRGDKRHPASQGYACEKPHRLDHYQNNPKRLLSPMRKREDGSFEAIDWDTAIREVAERFSRVKDEYGGASIMYYGGGGQGNHLPGAYSVATRRALGMRYRSNALAQEKTGEFWVAERVLGAQTRADFEHCEVGLFLGKNPWFSHGIPRARVTLKEISKDPARTLIVVDPRVSRTAELADIHLQVRPGTDAWMLSAMIAILFEEKLIDNEFISAHCNGIEVLQEHYAKVDVTAYSKYSGIDEALLRKAARIIGKAQSFASFEDLGVQMNRHSTLVSYLHRHLWLLTGNFGKIGAHFSPTTLVPIADGRYKKDTPVTGQRLIGGLVPCNAIADEILNDHPDRFRAMLVETANPAHSLADSQRMREALEALDTLVVIDVAMTETAQLADYVLPASTQFEKAEATFFNFEFPENYFHLRPRLLEPAEGTLSEAEIHSRLVAELGQLNDELVAELSAAAKESLEAYAQLFMAKVAMNPAQMGLAPVLLYRSLREQLPVEQAEGAVLLGLTIRAAMQAPKELAAAGFDGPPLAAGIKLFKAILENHSGIVFARGDWSDVIQRIGTPSGKAELALDDLLEVARSLESGPEASDDAYPFVLSAGERRAFTANTIVRDASWRKKDSVGALRIHPESATSLGIENGEVVKLSTKRGVLEVAVEITTNMQPGHVSLPNGMGLTGDSAELGGVPTNALTATESRDPFVGTPMHKYVPARIERIPRD